MYPTPAHAEAVEAVTAHFRRDPRVWALVLIGSLGSGRAQPDSDVDLAVFHDGPFDLPAEVARCAAALGTRAAANFGVYVAGIRVDLEPCDGRLRPSGGLPRNDPYELSIGNLAVYARAVWDPQGRWEAWRQQFLPYLPPAVRRERMQAVAADFRYNVAAIRRLAARDDFFAAMERLLYLQQYLLHYLFLKARIYPLDYSKRVELQCRELLHLPELVAPLRQALTVASPTAEAVAERAEALDALWRRFAEE
jgi:predicted nucleotidyltransferase